MHLEQRELSRILETAIVAARLGGQHAMEEINYVKISVKNGNELVTQADRQCQQIIVDRIREAFPDHGFIAEEGEHGKMFKRSPRGEPAIWWAIDPIDGTNNFAHGVPVFAVSIAAILEGLPIVGVVFDPATESMYTAIRDGEAQLNGRRISAGEEDIGPFAGIGLDSHFEAGVPPWVNQVIVQARLRNFGTTALHLAYVASGGLAGTVVCTPKLWDIAAGVVIAEAGGAMATDWKGRQLFPMDMDGYQGQICPTIAANKKVHAKLVDLMNS
jgi:myo-inositol-1(or 4)-monophosphatase